MFIDTEDWVRFPDVELYAEKRQISLHDAVIELVNKGLSHWEFGVDPDLPWLDEDIDYDEVTGERL